MERGIEGSRDGGERIVLHAMPSAPYSIGGRAPLANLSGSA
jgi:hypothetical protein